MTQFIELIIKLPGNDSYRELLVNLDDISTIEQSYVINDDASDGVGTDGCVITLKSKLNEIKVEEDLFEITDLIKEAQSPKPKTK